MSPISRDFQVKSFFIDEESYFDLSKYELSGNSGYNTSIEMETPDDLKLKRKSKFDPKILIWVAISSKDISKTYMVPIAQTVNEVVYINTFFKWAFGSIHLASS